MRIIRRRLVALAFVAVCVAGSVMSASAQRLALTLYGAGAPNAVVVHDLGTGRTEWRRDGTGGGFFTADGRYAVLTRRPSSSAPIRELYDTVTGLTVPMPEVTFDAAIAHPRALAVFGITLAATQGTDVGRLDPGGLRVFPACSPTSSVVQIELTVDGSRLLARCGGFAPNRLVVLDADTGQRLRDVDLPLGLISGSAANHDGSRVLLARASSSNASDVELVETATGQATTVFVDSPFPTGPAVGGCTVIGVTATRDVAAVNCRWTNFTTEVSRTELVRLDTLQRRTLTAIPASWAVQFSPDGATAIVASGPGLQLLDVAADTVIAQVSGNLGAPGVAFAPTAPSGLSATVAGGTVSLTWSLPAHSPAAIGYVLEAGTGPGLRDIGTVRLGPSPRLDIPGVPPGRYHARVRAVNHTGTGAASDDIVVTVP